MMNDEKGITVLSLFDGISCGRIALEREGVKVNCYFASEIKECAIKCSSVNYPDIIQIGDVKKVHYSNGYLFTEKGTFCVGKIDLLIGGSPCQDFSIASSFTSWRHKEGRGQYGLQGDKSRLFYEYLRLKEEIQPKYFLLENVRMKDKAKKELDAYMGVEGIYINSDLVSYQHRARYYWTNIPNVTIPEDKGVNFQHYKSNNKVELEEAKMHRTPSRERMWNNGNGKILLGNCDNITDKTKIGCLTRKQDRSPNSGLIAYKDFARYLTRSEIEQAQTLPIGYTSMLTYNQMQDVCGDGWTVDVIAHIFKGLKR